MSLKTQFIVAVIAAAALSIIIGMVKKKAIELRYALVWIIVGICVLVLDLFPMLIEKMSAMMGIYSPVNMLFFWGFCFLLGIIFVLTVAVSRMSVKIKELAQELALLRYEKEKHR